MTPTSPEQLAAAGYRLHHELAHDALVPFVKAQLKPLSPVSVFYWVFNLLLVAAILYFLFAQPRMAWPVALSNLSLGFLLFLTLLLPLHEWVHGLVYRWLGAPKVRYVAHWRQLVFYCVADQFVAGPRSFLWVALAPFVLINSLLLLALAFAGPALFYVLLGALLLHSGGCSGDFGLVAYFYNHRHQHPVTYDDVGLQKSFFYLKEA